MYRHYETGNVIIRIRGSKGGHFLGSALPQVRLRPTWQKLQQHPLARRRCEADDETSTRARRRVSARRGAAALNARMAPFACGPVHHKCSQTLNRAAGAAAVPVAAERGADADDEASTRTKHTVSARMGAAEMRMNAHYTYPDGKLPPAGMSCSVCRAMT